MDVGANPTAIAKPPLCKGRCPAGAEGLWHCEGRSIFGQGHNPSVSFADSSLYTREPLVYHPQIGNYPVRADG